VINNFDFIGIVDITDIKDILNNIGDDIWKEHTIRQTMYEAHKNTETVEIMWDIMSLRTNKTGKIHQNYYKFNIDQLFEKIKPFYVEKYGEGDFIRVLLVKLKKHTTITPHVDSGDSLTLCKRTHIAVITEPNVIFTVGGESKNMKEGEIWEINNQRVHSVDNNSDIDRVHFIIDYQIYNSN